MAGYSVGDRVEVRWKDVVYPGKVIKLHLYGKVDVLYEMTNTVGVFLTAKEHGLKLLPEKHSNKTKCSTAGCSSNADRKGLCVKHGSRGFCSAEGCDDGVYGHSVCKKHSAKPVCSWERCTTTAHSRGRCRKHVLDKQVGLYNYNINEVRTPS